MARLERMHAVLRQVFNNRLIFPPMDSPKRILECGYGAADWAVDVAEQFPDAEVSCQTDNTAFIKNPLISNLATATLALSREIKSIFQQQKSCMASAYYRQDAARAIKAMCHVGRNITG